VVCAADDFEAMFVTEVGVGQWVSWWQLPDVVGELGRPVRSFPSYRGQRDSPAPGGVEGSDESQPNGLTGWLSFYGPARLFRSRFQHHAS
jgi:hypothetical protein